MSTSTTRRTAAAATTAAGAAVLACAGLAATGRLGVTLAVVLAATAVTLAALTVLAALVRGLAAQLIRAERRLRGHVERGEATSAATLGAIRAELRGLSHRTEAIKQSLEDGRRVDFRQAEALGELRALLRPRAPMPATRGWAASPDVLLALAGQVLARRPKLVVECGSGASSLWLGYALERAGGGRVVALEHDERYADVTRDLVAAHGLGELVEVRTAPLRRWPAAGSPDLWYDTAAIADLTGIGLLFVDGPPGTGGPMARYPAGPELLPRCAADAVIVLDDTIREAEREISDRWLAEHPGLSRTDQPFEKGAHIFAFKPGEGLTTEGSAAYADHAPAAPPVPRAVS